ncbi:MAG: TlpA family protein disulfide reductase [Ignavibacteria bacterium]|nr:TlpA family protein disulfide reductase [Ignavibacteria bacterium]
MKKILLILLLVNLSPIMFAQSGVSVGDEAPALSVDEWLKGEPVTSFENDKVYLVEFWGTWCGPCIENIPHLSDIEKKYSSQGLVVIGVATHEFDGREKLDKFMKDRGSEMEYRVAFDTDLTMERDWDTGETGGDNFRLPVCFLIDKSGKVIFTGHPSDKKLEDMIESAVN